MVVVLRSRARSRLEALTRGAERLRGRAPARARGLRYLIESLERDVRRQVAPWWRIIVDLSVIEAMEDELEQLQVQLDQAQDLLRRLETLEQLSSGLVDEVVPEPLRQRASSLQRLLGSWCTDACRMLETARSRAALASADLRLSELEYAVAQVIQAWSIMTDAEEVRSRCRDPECLEELAGCLDELSAAIKAGEIDPRRLDRAKEVVERARSVAVPRMSETPDDLRSAKTAIGEIHSWFSELGIGGAELEVLESRLDDAWEGRVRQSREVLARLRDDAREVNEGLIGQALQQRAEALGALRRRLTQLTATSGPSLELDHELRQLDARSAEIVMAGEHQGWILELAQLDARLRDVIQGQAYALRDRLLHEVRRRLGQADQLCCLKLDTRAWTAVQNVLDELDAALARHGADDVEAVVEALASAQQARQRLESIARGIEQARQDLAARRQSQIARLEHLVEVGQELGLDSDQARSLLLELAAQAEPAREGDDREPMPADAELSSETIRLRGADTSLDREQQRLDRSAAGVTELEVELITVIESLTTEVRAQAEADLALLADHEAPAELSLAAPENGVDGSLDAWRRWCGLAGEARQRLMLKIDHLSRRQSELVARLEGLEPGSLSAADLRLKRQALDRLVRLEPIRPESQRLVEELELLGLAVSEAESLLDRARANETRARDLRDLLAGRLERLAEQGLAGHCPGHLLERTWALIEGAVLHLPDWRSALEQLDEAETLLEALERHALRSADQLLDQCIELLSRPLGARADLTSPAEVEGLLAAIGDVPRGELIPATLRARSEDLASQLRGGGRR